MAKFATIIECFTVNALSVFHICLLSETFGAVLLNRTLFAVFYYGLAFQAFIVEGIVEVGLALIAFLVVFAKLASS
jgi:hypothetical protein